MLAASFVFTMESVNTYFIACIVVCPVKRVAYIVNKFVIVCVVKVNLVNA